MHGHAITRDTVTTMPGVATAGTRVARATYSASLTLALLFIAILTVSVNAQESCTTPDRQTGRCIVLYSCPPLVALLKGGHNLSREVLDFLRSSHCGFQGNRPKVCCPTLDPVQQPSQPSNTNPWLTTPPPPQRPRPTPPGGVGGAEDRGPDVSNEPNLRLLPHDSCGPSAVNRIINGQKTAIFEYPWMARLGYKSTRNGNVSYRCGGSLISSRYVLTAAHCVEGIKSTEVLATVRLGEHDVLNDTDCSVIAGVTVCAPPVVDVGIEEILSHPAFSMDGPNRLQNDIALVRLDRRVKFTDAVRPICLPVGEEQYRELDNKNVIVAGWGTTESGYSSTELLQVKVPVVKGRQCAEVYKSMLFISPSKQMCAGGTKAGDSCNGDSGGPLKFAGMGINNDLRMLQFGIVSFGPRKCGSLGMPGVYTRVGYYMQWILRNLRP